MEKSMSDISSIQANLVFFYYPDLREAENFYGDILGLEKVLDYGFARIFRVSPSTFIGLVDETKGMHDPSEPKSVTLAPMQARFPPQTQETTRPADLGILANIIWLYYKDVPEAQAFYENSFGFELLVDQDFAKVYASSPTGFIGLVDESQGLHRFTPEKGVNVCFLTDEIDAWYGHFQAKKVKIKDMLEEMKSIPVKAFVAFDPGEYFIEFDHFLEDPKNRRIRELLR